MLRLSWTRTMVLAPAKWTFGQVFQDVSVVHGGMAIGDFDVAPAFERCKHHEKVGGALAFVLVIATGRTPRFHRDRQACLPPQLLLGPRPANPPGTPHSGPRAPRPRRLHGRS